MYRERKVSQFRRGQEAMIYIMNMAETYKEARLRWQKNHIGFTPRHQAHPESSDVREYNFIMYFFPSQGSPPLFRCNVGFPTYTWNMGFFFSNPIKFPLCLTPACSLGSSKGIFIYRYRLHNNTVICNLN